MSNFWPKKWSRSDSQDLYDLGKLAYTSLGGIFKEKAEAFLKLETLIAELSTKATFNEGMMNEGHAKSLYLEAYSRKEEIKFSL